MKSYRAADGSERLWFEPEEIEVIMEDELHKAGLFPSADHPTVNVEDLIEVHLKVKLDQHAVLDCDVLGAETLPSASIRRHRWHRDDYMGQPLGQSERV